jgi:hypothetical protein
LQQPRLQQPWLIPLPPVSPDAGGDASLSDDLDLDDYRSISPQSGENGNSEESGAGVIAGSDNESGDDPDGVIACRGPKVKRGEQWVGALRALAISTTTMLK